jgi:hypothetical protein
VLVPALVFLVAGLLVAGCASAPSFDPSTPCSVDGRAVDGRAPGAYPELEMRIPTGYDGRAPDRLDSGRNCSRTSLGTMINRGITEVRFAGGLWEVGERSGVSLAVFAGDGLTPAILSEFYEAGARTARRTDAVETSELVVDGVTARRLDTLNDESFQSVVVWPAQDGLVRVALVGSDIRETVQRAIHEDRVKAALAVAWP